MKIITVAWFDVVRLPDHLVGVGVPDADDALLGDVVGPGEAAAGAVVGDGGAEGAVRVGPVHVHVHVVGRRVRIHALTGCEKILNIFGWTPQR